MTPIAMAGKNPKRQPASVHPSGSMREIRLRPNVDGTQMPYGTGHSGPDATLEARGIPLDMVRIATTRSALARRLRLVREAQRLSQAEVAELVGCEPRTLRRIEHGLCWPRLDTYLRLAEALRIPIDTLLSQPEPIRERPPRRGGSHE